MSIKFLQLKLIQAVFFSETRLLFLEKKIMFETNSAEIRRFFDLLGSSVCGLIFGYIVLEGFCTNRLQINQIVISPLIFIMPLLVYLFFHKLVWEKLNTKAFGGNLNFILISLPSVSFLFLFYSFVVFKLLPNLLVERDLSKFIFAFGLTNLFAILPMGFFWIIGILTSWKFSKKNILP